MRPWARLGRSSRRERRPRPQTQLQHQDQTQDEYPTFYQHSSQRRPFDEIESIEEIEGRENNSACLSVMTLTGIHMRILDFELTQEHCPLAFSVTLAGRTTGDWCDEGKHLKTPGPP